MSNEEFVSYDLSFFFSQALSIDLDISTVSDLNYNLLGSQTVSNFEGSQVHWFIVGSIFLSVSVSESNKGVNLERRVSFSPGGDGEEGAYNISVDGQKLILVVSSVDMSEIKEAGFGEVVPIFLF